ncbi:MAG: hypothetical protein A2X58_11165 [Nitrospirae bacterium GWC2_56_14]|nr:MAG: hypothetical protein A2X58_11165 [Nitrospirae bacterium GWC2_56_14]
MWKNYHVVLLLAILLFTFSNASATPIMNGNFSDDLNGWTEEYDLGYTPPASVPYPAIVDAGKAVLSTQGYDTGIWLSSLYQELSGFEPGTIQFSLGIKQIEDSSGPSDGDLYIDDYLNVSFGAAFASFNIGNDFSTPFSFTVTGDPGTLYFDLYDQDDGKITSFLIDDVTFSPFTTPVPEPSTFALFAFALGALGVRVRASRSKKRM